MVAHSSITTTICGEGHHPVNFCFCLDTPLWNYTGSLSNTFGLSMLQSNLDYLYNSGRGSETIHNGKYFVNFLLLSTEDTLTSIISHKFIRYYKQCVVLVLNSMQSPSRSSVHL